MTIQREYPLVMSISGSTRAALVGAAVICGIMVAMIVDIMLARRGISLAVASQGVLRGGTPIRAALAWWAITGTAFIAGFALAAIVTRVSWLYLRSLRWIAAGLLALALAAIGDLVPHGAADSAGHHALATLAALAAATLMAGFGAFFAVRH